MRSQYLLHIKIYITLSFRWHIQILFTHRQMHLNHQDCYNPLVGRMFPRACITILSGLCSGCCRVFCTNTLQVWVCLYHSPFFYLFPLQGKVRWCLNIILLLLKEEIICTVKWDIRNQAVSFHLFRTWRREIISALS